VSRDRICRIGISFPVDFGLGVPSTSTYVGVSARGTKHRLVFDSRCSAFNSPLSSASSNA
ncbi:hypothetical protein K438DRAFT_1842647, partial [Mycena galopus ATCC 62051]